LTLRALVLVDGEHYPPVLLDALGAVRARGYDVVGAVMLGGAAKLRGPMELGDLPIVVGPTQADALRAGIDRFEPDAVVDLSDAPVVGARERFRLAGIALAHGVAYVGADFRLDPPPRPRLSARPTIAVIGTGKRTGKTAVAAALARHAAARGIEPVIVAMGRGGPATPVVVRGDVARPTARDLVALADAGEHAASDSYEDAVVAGVTTVGARRAGAGLAGAPFHDTVAAAVAAADALEPGLIVLEGSGTAIPPAAAGATVLVVGGLTPPEELAAGLGPYRWLISDLAIVTMAEESVLGAGTLSALTSSLSEFAGDVPVIRTVFRPAPVGHVEGRKTFLATTAPPAAGPALRTHLERVHGAVIVGITHRLADRSGLSQDLSHAEGTYEVLLTEVKAAAIDVAARTALASGADVVFADNEPIAVDGDLAGAFDRAIELARARAGGS
jgi:cyclic 2,3-diphosphoglycerate synthetase